MLGSLGYEITKPWALKSKPCSRSPYPQHRGPRKPKPFTCAPTDLHLLGCDIGSGLGFRVLGFGPRVLGLGFRVCYRFWFRVQGFGSGFGFRVSVLV